MRIRSSLILLVFAVLLPTILGTAVGVGFIYSEQQNAYRSSIQERSRAMSLVVDQEFARRESMLSVLAASSFLEDRDFKKFYSYAQKLVSTGKSGILLQDNAGKTIVTTRLPFNSTEFPTLDVLTNLRKRSSPDATIISNIFLSPITQTYIFAIQMPVKHSGKISYYLSMSFPASELQSLFGEHKFTEGWFGTIFDRNGVVVARTKDAERFLGRTPLEDVRKNLVDRGEGSYDGTTLDGMPVTYFISRAPMSGWIFMTVVPHTHLQQTAVRASVIMSGIAVFMLVLAITLAFIVGRRIARPMETLRLAITNMKEGVAVEVHQSGIMEIDAVNKAMAQASHEIHLARVELENRVADAVASVETSQRALLQAQKLEALGRLTGGIAHDFNNILQTLKSGLRLAYLSSIDPRIKSTLATCERAVDRAADLVRQLMSFGRIQDVHLATVDLPEKVIEITPMLKGGLRGDIKLQLDMADDIWPVLIDPLQFELALLNLSINARDAMPEGGSLKISIQNRTIERQLGELTPGDYVEISVADTGTGMTPDVIAKAIDPFFTTKSIGKGTGLGLAQVYGFVRQANGTLTIESSIGEGTTIKLYLVRTENLLLTKKQPSVDEKDMFLEGRVLLVDDDLLVLDVVKPALELAGLEVRVAQNGDDALAILGAGEPFDAVFSDIVMPGRTDGIKLATIIEKRFPKTKVVLATGYTEQRIATTEVRVLAKPYSSHEVLNALRDALSAARTSSQFQ